MTACIYYHPEAYSTRGPKLMGRNAAGESFLRGFFEHSRSDEFWVQVSKAEHAQLFAKTAQHYHRTKHTKVVSNSNLGALAQVGVVFFPGPGIGQNAFNRIAYGDSAWSLCGITHTTSSAGAMDALASLITAPIQPWDALICTSNAVRDNVTHLLQAEFAYLSSRLGASRVVLPQLPVIPLGVHTADFDFSDQEREVARRELGVDREELVVLFMGRLSFHAKAHPLAMYLALEAASRRCEKRIVLVQCGWFANDFIEKAYIEAANQACPSVKVRILDGRKAESRKAAWAGADIFCSLSDNIQETFGISPIEAMAAGLPVVVSDWDGYKDTVRDGVDGFRIPTIMPQAGLAADLALRHALELDSYDMYCGHTCMLIAVDIEATTLAFEALFKSEDLRQKMGQSGRLRARSVYDWRIIINDYEELWAELSNKRRAHPHQRSANHRSWPARMDPFDAFSSYPTSVLTPQTSLSLVDKNTDAAIKRATTFRRLSMVAFANVILPSEDEIVAVINRAKLDAIETPITASEWVRDISDDRRASVFRSLAWFLKIGIMRCHVSV